MPDGDPPGRLVLEQRLRQGEEEHARRVTDDGRVWTRSTVDARLEQGAWSFGTGDGAWRELAILPPAAFAALEDAIRDSGLLDTAPEHGPDSTVIGGSEEHWTVALDGRQATTLLRGVPEVHVASVTAVAEALHAALAAADS
ncbi:MAG: hypothetical protein ACXWZZ_11350, partial [Solirubrobacteraceae bacterium]